MSGSDTYYLDPALYDIVYAEYRSDLVPLVESARAANGPVLEVCCGNGRVLLPMLEAGIDADGLDRDAAMLGALRAKLAAAGRRTTLHQADMRDFTLPRRYRVIVIAFNSFLHNLTQRDQLATLRCCRQHLDAGGRLELIAFHPNVDLLVEWANRETVTRDAVLPDGRRMRVVDRASDQRIEQIRHLDRRLEFFDADGRATETLRVSFDIRYVFKPEMELLLRVAGYSRWSVRPLGTSYTTADAAADRPLQEGDILWWTAWKD